MTPLLLALACAGDAPTGAIADQITLVYSANVDGEIEPCG